ncbi:chromosome partitioning protein ParA [Pilimelia anulata]|uniref:Chromosome partitioning protein ParA n=1 Tax=Pilimelia anulata TaxID=53371 RepID=A0A8J3BBU5_9ACTN|nr:ParA family protein [Pilimelia anulata]GGK10753.1 chromosome partitioning protein ParA [Pilimelia anulata]
MPGLAILNYKGGVGKSTLARELAASLARRQQRSLAVDMDPQANLSRRLGFQSSLADPLPTLAGAIKNDVTGGAADILTPCSWNDPLAQYIDLLPSSFDLENRISEAGTVGAVVRLRNIMTGLGGHHWRIYDCAPSLGHLTHMALVAAGAEEECGVLLVTEPEQDGLEGCIKAYEFMEGYAAVLGVPHLRVLGIVINRVRRTELHQENITKLVDRYGSLVWEPHVPLWTTLADAHNSAVPLHTMPGPKADELVTKFETITDRVIKEMAA